MSFCTAINCMDGRTQIPVNTYMKKRFGVEHVDTITEPGPNRIVGGQSNRVLLDSILSRVAISVKHHGSVGIAIVGHHDCAGNPDTRENQLRQIESAVSFIAGHFKSIPVIGLWVDENWQVSEVSCLYDTGSSSAGHGCAT